MTEIARVFGGSTAGGISYQVRNAKDQGLAMKKAADAGGDPSVAFQNHRQNKGGANTAPATPGGTSGGGTAKSPTASRARRARASSPAASSARRPSKKIKTEEITTK